MTSNQNELRRIARDDQQDAAIGDWARRMATYYTQLVHHGIDRDHALELALHYQQMILEIGTGHRRRD